ncbi:MAG: hypothetical protein MJZ23_06650 [Paludibacteraceae bacterium]|nr:hypothetical protein [Paludibacteraceae bacterium]
MKKLIIAALALAMSVTAGAKTPGIQDVQPKNGFNLGIMIGVPPANESTLDYATQDPIMPNVSIDGNWTVASGFINTKKFGKNGAIDLGFYQGFCDYQNKYDDEILCMQHEFLVRCAFHFSFAKGLDVYAGMLSGLDLYIPYGDDKEGWYCPHDDYHYHHHGYDHAPHQGDRWVERSTEGHFAMGPFIGCKYFFTKAFGLKAEFATDFASNAAPGASFGLAFKFK